MSGSGVKVVVGAAALVATVVGLAVALDQQPTVVKKEEEEEEEQDQDSVAMQDKLELFAMRP